MNRMNELRAAEGLSMKEAASRLGMPYTTYVNYEKGYREPNTETLVRIAEFFGTTVDGLLGNSPVLKAPRVINMADTVGSPFHPVAIPVVASVKAGYDGLAVEEATGEFEYVTAEDIKGHSPSEYRILRVSGDSMYPRIIDGDKVLVHVQPSVDSGDIAVILYNGEEATVKKVRYRSGEDWLEMVPANPEYKPRRIEGSDLEICKVFGKVVKLIRDF